MLPLRCMRCVSRDFCSQIKSPDFINKYIKEHLITKDDEYFLVFRALEDPTRTRRRKNLLSFHSTESLGSITSSPNLEVPQFDCNIMVCGPCNGLICLASRSDIISVLLCNPAQREFRILPPSALRCEGGWAREMPALGLGFDTNHDDYKVVAFAGGLEKDYTWTTKVEIYRLRTNSWTQAEFNYNHVSLAGIVDSNKGTLFNGRFHWIVLEDDGSPHALSFDFSNGKFDYSNLPYEYENEPPIEHENELVGMSRLGCLRVLNGSLAFLLYTETDFPFPEEKMVIDIWVMREYGVNESWTKQFTLGPLPQIRHPLCFWDDRAILVETKEGRLESYALDNGERIAAFNIHGLKHSLAVMAYQGSFVFLGNLKHWLVGLPPGWPL